MSGYNDAPYWFSNREKELILIRLDISVPAKNFIYTS